MTFMSKLSAAAMWDTETRDSSQVVTPKHRANPTRTSKKTGKYPGSHPAQETGLQLANDPESSSCPDK